MAAGLTLATGSPARSSIFNPETFMLDNGMQVVVIPNHRAPVVAHWVWYRVGTADSPLGKSGLPHFLEHLMFKATDKIPQGEFSKIIARNGGNDNAVTSYDFTAYYQMIARDRLELVMGMEADRMVNLHLTDEAVLPERDVVIEERRSRVDNEPSALLGEQLNVSQYLHHPYRLPVIGWMHEMESYTREDAVNFYKTWYAPNNAILVVAGDITADELRPLAERTYGQIPARDVPARVRVTEPPQRAERRIEMRDARVRQPSFVRSYLAPSYDQEDQKTAYALEVLSELFGGGGTSRLYRSVVVDQALASGIAAYYRGSSLDDTTFRIYASPRPNVSLDDIEKAINEQIATLLADGVTEDELARVKKRMLADAVYARDSLSGAARAFGAALTTGQTVDDVEAWPDRISAVSIEDINNAAKLVFDIRRSVTAKLLPEETEPTG
ncbi:MAG: insulinase family protein [Geminicoccaceae bacterium]|nr:insulinase family protein [Geminicoccaceae bacterium]MCB9944453.1 insulinase family protein [Geminicoccaceae bacterium]